MPVVTLKVGKENIIAEIIGAIFFIWFVAPAIIIHSKGRRWWVWLPFSIFLPIGFLFIALFMHGVEKDGKRSMS